MYPHLKPKPGFTRLTTDAYDPSGVIQPGEFVVANDLWYHRPIGESIKVPRGFITDFASIPKIVQLVPGFDVNGDSRPAAVLHDYLYCEVGKVDVWTGPMKLRAEYTREECDEIFAEALTVLKHNSFVVAAMYSGVAVGGWQYWGNRRKTPREDNYVPEAYDWVMSCDS